MTVNDILEKINGLIGGSPWFVILLIGTGLFFTIYLKFPHRYLGRSVRILRGKGDNPNSKGDTSHFQSLATALSGTVGTGNIAGVALAIHLGGPASLFWMIVTAFFGMTTKFVEVTLSHKYREFAEDGSVSGGPMYYMKNRLNLKWLAAIVAIATIISSFGTGSMPQIASISDALFSTYGVRRMTTGIVLSILLALIIIGGIKRIAKVTEKLVPIMGIIYVLGAIIVIASNYENILPSLRAVVGDVFTGTAAVGGFVGSSIMFALNRGVNRGLFSNEAGQGSAPIAHAAAKTDEPVSEGLVALLEPLIDTIIICSITGLVILSTGVWNQKMENQFQYTDIQVLDGSYHESNTEDLAKVSAFLEGSADIALYSNALNVVDGEIDQSKVTILSSRSFAEDIVVRKDGELYTGTLLVDKGKIQEESSIKIRGISLVHSAKLTSLAFSESILGRYGKHIVAIGLLLFAFSTSISWSYYGTRSMTFLFGSTKYNSLYLWIYVAGFFLASMVDTMVIWTFSGIAIALMTIPNLAGLLMLHKEMKNEVKEYFSRHKKD
ncbi:MAG: alanine/glycine:cation symporter family protein [Bacteroidales bacterium]